MIEHIGQQLRQAREARSLTLEQVAKSTHMRLHYLQALEAGDFSALPSVAQARGFLRTYSTFLGLKPEVLLESLDGGVQPDGEAKAGPAARPTTEIEEGAKTGAGTPEIEQASTGQVKAIFEEVGGQLQRQRELLGLSLDDVARHTLLRTHYLRALECGDLNELPSPVQGRGMLKNYATFLGLDPEPLLLRFAEGLQARLVVKQASRSQAAPRSEPRPSSRSPLRRLLSADLIIGGVLALFLAGFIIWGAIRVFALRSEQEASMTAPSVAEVLLYTPTASATPSPTGEPSPAATEGPVDAAGTEPAAGAEAQATEGITLPAGTLSGPVQVYVTVRQRAWMRVTVDGEIEFDGRVIPGSAYQFAGENQVEILTGNGAGLQIFFNQEDLGTMGLFGQVVQRVFTPQGIETPTPTITVTGTATPRASATLESTATLQEFITATP